MAEEKVSASTQNQALAALLFVYQQVLGRDLQWLGNMVHAKRPTCVPVVLRRDEVRSLLAHLDGVPWLVCALLHGGGLRLLEALQLRVKDIDLERKAFLKRFPQRAGRIAAVEKAWKTFRERLCTLEASEYEGGSMEAQVYGECMAREAQLHLERLKTLRAEWSKH
jgi:integrase